MAKKNKEEWKIYGNVFDQYTIQVLRKLEGQGHFKELVSEYKLGKEANVFLASTDEGQVVVKIYRLENCNFNKMYEYLSQDERYANIKGQRRKIIFSWVQREYRNLLKARETIRVPTPLAVRDNVLVIELIGSTGDPAPQLKDAHPKNPTEFYQHILEGVKRLHSSGLVHADLSPFNILNHDEQPVFIDFSQATTTDSPGWKELYDRDVDIIVKFFVKLGVDAKKEDFSFS